MRPARGSFQGEELERLDIAGSVESDGAGGGIIPGEQLDFDFDAPAAPTFDRFRPQDLEDLDGHAGTLLGGKCLQGRAGTQKTQKTQTYTENSEDARRPCPATPLFRLGLTQSAVAEKALAATTALVRAPLRTFVDRAVELSLDDNESGNGAYRSPGFVLARCLKEHSQLALLDEGWKVAEIVTKECGDIWSQLPNRDSRGEPLEPRRDFVFCWTKLRATPAPAAIRPVVEAYPLESERYPADCDSPFRAVASAAWWYAIALKRREIFLSCRDAEAATGVPFRTAARFLKHLVLIDGFLRIARRHPNETRRATEYVVDIEAVELVEEKPVVLRGAVEAGGAR